MLELEEHVSHLDELMAQLIQTVERTSKEMREFKQEMRVSRERSEREMQEFKQEMRVSRERSEREMQEFKQEMRTFREHSEREMQEFKQEMRNSKRELDKKWGELSRKLGTMAEDLVAPSIPQIFKQVIGYTGELDYLAVRVKYKKPKSQEFDVVAVCGDYVFINETKSNLKVEYINDFHALMLTVRDYFPTIAEKKFIGAIASLYVDESLVRYGEKLGLIVLGFGENLMDVLNTPQFKPKLF